MCARFTLPRDWPRIACAICALGLPLALTLSWASEDSQITLYSPEGHSDPVRHGWVQLGAEIVAIDAAMLVCLLLAITVQTPPIRRWAGVVLCAATVGIAIWRMFDIASALGTDLEYSGITFDPSPGAGPFVAAALALIGLAGCIGVRTRRG